jgi:Peptidase C10 family/Dockerin type I domain
MSKARNNSLVNVGRRLFDNALPKYFILSLTLILSVFIMAETKAELASSSEMEQVCHNWLIEMVNRDGSWAGDANPRISHMGEIRSDEDLLLARYYSIEPSGFVVIPVLKEMNPIKAYSDISILDDKQTGGFLLMLKEMLSRRMELYENKFGSLDASQPADGEAIFGRSHRAEWDRLTLDSKTFAAQLSLDKSSRESAGPLLTSSWHQRAPYSNLCPMGDGGRCVVGCVATATAQIMNFWQWPASGVGDHSYWWDGDNSCEGSTPGQTLYADFSDEYDWDNMIDSCDDGCGAADSAALAHLNYEVGVAFDMIYGACGSGTYTSMATQVFPGYFKYSIDITRVDRYNYNLEEWYNLIKVEIDNSRPIQYRIRSHSIVCDGYRDQSGQYEYHMNYGWGGSFTTWFVLDSLYCYWVEPDSICPADEELMITNIKPQTEPIISFIGRSVVDTLGDSDGHADVGETFEINSSIINNGWNAYNVQGELTSTDGYITINSSSVNFAMSLPWGESASSQSPYEITISPSCPDPYIATFHIEMSTAAGFTFTDSFYVFIGDTEGFEDNVESGDDYWVHKSNTIGFYEEWHQETYRYHSSSTSWKAGGEGDIWYGNSCDGALITPPFLLPEDAVLNFWHWIDAEIDQGKGTAWDGAIVMISSGDGVWTQIEPSGGYPFTIIQNAASPFDAETPCFSGSFDWSPASFDLSAYSGAVQIMFRFGSDGNTTGEGWYIDDVEIVSGLICGDANSDKDVNVSDGVSIINYVFISGSLVPAPLCKADANGDETVNISDAVWIINYVFIGGAPPVFDCCD